MSTNDPYQTPLNESADANRFQGQEPTGMLRPSYYVQPPQPTNNLAVASLVLGILWVFWIGSVLAVIFGHTALKEIKRRCRCWPLRVRE